MTVDEAVHLHEPQVQLFAEDPRIDYLVGYTLTDPNEAIGMVKAAAKHDMPIAISFIVTKADCALRSGHTIKVIQPTSSLLKRLLHW